MIGEFNRKVIERRNRAIIGQPNCIPFGISQLRPFFPGIDKCQYIGITGTAKSGKTSFMSNLMLYDPLEQLFQNNGLYDLQYLYISLEEPYEKILARYVSYLFYRIYNKRIDYNLLMSNDSERLMSDEQVKLFLSDDIQKRLQFFINHVTFVFFTTRIDQIIFKILQFANKCGKVTFTEISNDGVVEKLPTAFTPNNPNQYRVVILDNLTNVDTSKSHPTKFSAIEKLSSKIVGFKDLFNFTFVALIQQNPKETGSMAAYNSGNILGTVSGIRDYPQLAGDVTDLWSISNPSDFQQCHTFGENGNYYDIDRLGGYFRVFKILRCRNGECNIPANLFFDGVSMHYELLPSVNSEEMCKFYQMVDSYNDSLFK